MKSQDRLFLLNIDIITETDGIITVEGWVICPTGKPQFRIQDADGQELAAETETVSRPDVSRILLGNDSQPDCGFRLHVPRSSCSEYTLFVTSGRRIRKNRFDLDGFTLNWKYNSPRHILHLLCRNPRIALPLLREEGFPTYLHQLQGNIRREKYRYHTWLARHLPDEDALTAQREAVFSYSPRISLIVPTFRTPERFLRQMIESVQEQTYPNWELCIADGSYPETTVSEILKEYAALDSRIHYTVLQENRQISGNTNAALALAKGEWIALMDHDDILAPSALFELVERMNEDADIDVLYTDEDKVSLDLRTYFYPTFKPDFDPDFLRSGNYICHFFCVRKSIVDRVGEFDSACDGSQDYDFILRCTEQAKKVSHLARMLYHWRSHPNSTAAAAENKLYCYEAGVRALTKHLERCRIPARACMNAYLGHYCLFYEPQGTPLISVVIWGKITEENVRKTRTSILNASSYRNYEFLYGKKEAANATGDYLFFIKAGAELLPYCVQAPNGRVLSEETVQKEAFPYNMLGLLAQPQAGAVGGRVLDAADTFFYAGIVRNPCHAADYSFRLEPGDSTGYLARPLNTQRTAAASLCCMMIRRAVYEEAGGLDETLSTAFDDVALCYRLTQSGYYHIYTPTVTARLGGLQGQAMHLRYPAQAKQVATQFAELLRQPDPNFNPNLIFHMGKWEMKE